MVILPREPEEVGDTVVPGLWAPWLGEGSAPGISAVGDRGTLSLLPSGLPCTLGSAPGSPGEGGPAQPAAVLELCLKTGNTGRVTFSSAAAHLVAYLGGGRGGGEEGAE